MGIIKQAVERRIVEWSVGDKVKLGRRHKRGTEIERGEVGNRSREAERNAP